ncbi:MAG TPA: DUF3857 domain-containing protein [Lentimicrobium sp.]|nr:DUF3857 domain-containing protein [Lentimicrobium sp.]
MKQNHFLRMVLFGMLFLSMSELFAQDYATKIGKCTEYEMKMTACPFDSIAEAMVLYDIGTLSIQVINDSYKYVYERKTKIKVFTKAGIDQAEFVIPYYKGDNGYERVTGLKGNTYNLVNGKIVATSLDSKNAFEEKKSDHWYNKKFAMPDVKEGSVFDISYTITSPYLMVLPTWDFQSDIPILYSEYKVTTNPHFEYAHSLTGGGFYDDYQKYDDNGEVTYINLIPYHDAVEKFVMKNIPAFRDESYITSSKDYMRRLHFQLTTYKQSNGFREDLVSTWSKLCQELLDSDSFGGYMKSCQRDGKDIVQILTLMSDSSTLSKAKKIDRYLKSNYSYNGDESYMAGKTLKEVSLEKSGSAAQLNLMAVGYFRAAGFQADPVLLSTRSNGKIQVNYPFVDAFDYVVAMVKVDSILYMVDVTEPLLNFNEVPSRCLNDVGLVVRKDNPDWIHFESLANSDNRHEIELIPNPDSDSLSMNVKLTSSFYEGVSKRKRFKNNYAELAKDLLGKDYLSYDSIRCANLTDFEKPFELTFNKKEQLERLEDKLLINPFCDLVPTENPFKQPERNYPVDFNYKWSKTFSIKIKIPEGYKVFSKPAPFTVNNKNIRIVYTINDNEPGYLTVVALYMFKKDVYPAENYNEIKDYYNKIVSKFNENIILQAVGI